jgi:hypothetical protein
LFVYLLPDRCDVFGRLYQAESQWLIGAQDAEQKVLGFDMFAARLAGFVAGEEDGFSRRFRESFEHSRY